MGYSHNGQISQRCGHVKMIATKCEWVNLHKNDSKVYNQSPCYIIIIIHRNDLKWPGTHLILILHCNINSSPVFLEKQRTSMLLDSRKFSSAKNSIKSDRRAVCQEFIFVKRRSSLVCSLVVRSLLFCLSFIFTFMDISDPTLVVCEKN